MIRAITFDYWDTLYEGGALPERVALRRTAVGALLGAYGRDLPEERANFLHYATAVWPRHLRAIHEAARQAKPDRG